MMYLKDKLPLISVITPAYNAAEFLHNLLKSVANQDYPYIEHIVVDDGSCDHGATLNIIKSFPNLVWWSQINMGQYATINRAIQKASGDYIIVISADDYFAPNAFNIARKNCINKNDIDIIYGYTHKVNVNGTPVPNQLRQILPVPTFLFKYYGFVSHCSMFVSRKLILNNNIFWNETYRYAGDWDWIARIFACSNKDHFEKAVFSLYRVHVGQISTENENVNNRRMEVELISKTNHGNIKITNLIKLILSIRSGIYRRMKKLFFNV